MASLRDWLGRAVQRLMLTMEIATPQPGGVRQVVSGHPADGLTPQRLARILRAADDGDPQAYFELAEDIEERDPHYLSVLATRRRSVAQLPITVKPASDSAEHKAHAKLVQEWVDDGVLRASLFDILDAVGKGISITEVDWQHRSGWVLPMSLTWRPQRWFTFDRADGETPLLRDSAAGTPLLPHKFVIHRHKSKSGLTIRSGIARVAVWAWMYKSFTVRDWAIFVQNYGQPIRIGRYGRGATEAEKDVLWRAVSMIAGDCAAIVPQGMDIEFHEVASKGTSTDMYERRADWLDRQTSKVVLGQTTTTDAISGGHAVSQEHRLVQEDIERDDAGVVTGTINGQLVPNIVAFNFGPQDRYPHVRVGRPDEVPLGEFAEAFDKLARHGLTAEEAWVRDRLGIPTPAPEATLIGGRAAAPLPDEASAAAQSLDRLFGGRQPKALHAAGAPARRHEAVMDRLAERLDEEAAWAMSDMIEEVRQAIMSASDLRDAAERVAALGLEPDALADAMARGMALAHLAGQASLIDDLQDRT